MILNSYSWTKAEGSQVPPSTPGGFCHQRPLAASGRGRGRAAGLSRGHFAPAALGQRSVCTRHTGLCTHTLASLHKPFLDSLSRSKPSSRLDGLGRNHPELAPVILREGGQERRGPDAAEGLLLATPDRRLLSEPKARPRRNPGQGGLPLSDPHEPTARTLRSQNSAPNVSNAGDRKDGDGRVCWESSGPGPALLPQDRVDAATASSSAAGQQWAQRVQLNSTRHGANELYLTPSAT